MACADPGGRVGQWHGDNVDVPIDSDPVVDHSGANLALDIFVLDQRLGALLDVVLRGTGVSSAQFAVYSQISRGIKSPKELLAVLGLRPATLSGYLSSMERRGDLNRSREASDRREHRLALTRQGRATYARCLERFRIAVQAMTSELGGIDEINALRSALGKIDAAIQRAQNTLPNESQ